VLIGATTENPFFEVNAPLISRSRVVELTPLTDDDIRTIVQRALTDAARGLGGSVTLDPEALDRIITLAGGDARVALTTLELAAQIAHAEDPAASAGSEPAQAPAPAIIGAEVIGRATALRAVPYDKAGDAHYDVISAFIKSMRGSDPDAAVYWLARMVAGGEDPKFIARRMLIFASEDVGMADPQALLIAQAAFKSAESIGWPEARINLAHAAIYLALAPKSNAAYLAIDEALNDLREAAAERVPDHLRDRHRPGSDKYPAYLYPHDHPGARVDQQYLPDGLVGKRYYRPRFTAPEADGE